jgi:hypothetical protein
MLKPGGQYILLLKGIIYLTHRFSLQSYNIPLESWCVESFLQTNISSKVNDLT